MALLFLCFPNTKSICISLTWFEAAISTREMGNYELVGSEALGKGRKKGKRKKDNGVSD